ncbi:helix-turn-helix domain-containing protein [Vibrio sp. F74]|uniref:helix-turn-helix domain-containing protein n=1 Tax=Vibrio sp. F74 TaxID=700020 RepID=UPI0035F57A48
MRYSKKIPEYTFLKGHDFTNNLKMILGCKNLQELSKVTGVPTSTFSTWNMKNRTSFELLIKIHLTLGIPMKDLSLGYQISNDAKEALKVEEKSTSYMIDSNLPALAQSQASSLLESFELKNGQLVNRHATIFDSDLLVEFNDEELLAVKDRDQVFLINTGANQAISGLYLVNIDGLLSLNQIQRIPGKKVAIAFNNSTLNVSEDDISVVGKVVTEIKNILD